VAKKKMKAETFEERRKRWNPTLDEIKQLVKEQGDQPIKEYLAARRSKVRLKKAPRSSRLAS
jgi:hypothetical protein